MSELFIRFILLAVAVTIIYSTATIFNKQALADTISWTSSTDPTLTIDSYQPGSASPVYGNCTPTKRYLSNNRSPESDNKADICLVEKDRWRYGKYSYRAPFSSTVETGYAISFEGEEMMYRVLNFNPENAYNIPNSNSILNAQFGESSTAQLPFAIYPDIRDYITPETFGTYGVRYVYDYVNDSPFELKRPNGTAINPATSAVSDNGQWIISHVPSLGVLRINVATHEVKRISQYGAHLASGASLYTDISDDGTHAVLAGPNLGYVAGFRVYAIADDCGDAVTNTTTSDTPIASPCGEKNLNSFIASQLGADYNFTRYSSISPDGGEIYAWANSAGSGVGSKWFTLAASGYDPLRLDYLALGDSYSSGEGDTEKDEYGNKYYREYTDVEEDLSNNIPREKMSCQHSFISISACRINESGHRESDKTVGQRGM